MISLTPDEVERRFAILGIPSRFTNEEKRELGTTAVVRELADAFEFPTPKGNAGLNILNLRQLLGTDPFHQPSFFEHPWYLDEAFAKENCEPGWHCIYRSVLPESVSEPLNYASSLK